MFNNVVEKTKGRFGREGHGLFYTPGGGGGEVKGEGVSTPSRGGEKGGGWTGKYKESKLRLTDNELCSFAYNVTQGRDKS